MQPSKMLKFTFIVLLMNLVVRSTVAQPSSSSDSKPFGGSIKLPPEVTDAYDAQANLSLKIEHQARQFLAERRFPQAEETCYRALSISPKWNGEPMSSTAFQLLGDIYREEGRYSESLEPYFKARQHTQDSELDLGIALTYLKMGDLKNARKFYDEKKHFGYGLDLSLGKRGVFLAALPGTETAKTMEASILYAWGCEKSSHADIEESVPYFKKALLLVPHNPLIAYKCASDLASFYRSKEAVPYWARATVFGKGYIAEKANIELRNILMPDKVEQALREAKKIK